MTVIEALDEFLPMTDHDISKETLKEFKKQGLDIKLGSKVTSTKELKNSVKVKFESNDQENEMEFDKLIVAVGRAPNSSNVISDELNIEIEDGFIKVNDFCQTSVNNIWAIGDVVRGPMLAHKGSEEGIMVAERIAEKHTEVNYDLVPSVIVLFLPVAFIFSGSIFFSDIIFFAAGPIFFELSKSSLLSSLVFSIGSLFSSF